MPARLSTGEYGRAPIAMFNQYHGNDMELLRALAARVLALDPAPPLVEEVVVVPNRGIETWFNHGVAQELGIAAGVRCVLPAPFAARLATDVLGPADAVLDRAWSKEQLEIRLLGLLPRLLEQPGFEPVRAWLAVSPDPRRTLALARRLAALFDQYLLHRPEWMLAWEQGRAGADGAVREHPWQPVLWHALHGELRARHPGAVHGAARRRQLVARLRDRAEPCPGLPRRVLCFGLGVLAPALLDVLLALAERCEVHFFHFNPCQEYWNQSESRRARARRRLAAGAIDDDDHPLLAAWGRLGSEQLQALIEAESRGGAIHTLFEPNERGTLLATLQNDILALHVPEQQRILAPGDTSLRLAGCHSPLREIEALQDALLGMFESLERLAPREIVVMAPDIALYAPHIEAVFGGVRGTPRWLPYAIADRATGSGSMLARAFRHLLALPESRLRAGEVFALLAVPAIARRFELDGEDIEALREQAAAAGVRWGLDAGGGAGDAPGLARNTWRFGLERLLLGLALEDDELFAGSAALSPGGGEEAVRLGALADFVARIEEHAQALRAPRTPPQWQDAITRLIVDFCAEDAGDEAELAELRNVLAAVFDALDEAAFTGPLAREVLADLIGSRLDEPAGTRGFLRGGITFCQMTPLRSIPFRVVCLLGMDAASFPRNRHPSGFDLMARARRPGDPARRDDDRYLFLESVLAAREVLYISRVARAERDNARREPAVPLSEFCAYVERHWGVEALARITLEHPLKPFDVAYFRTGSRLRSYRGEWLAAAAPRARDQRFCAAPLPPPALEAIALEELLSFFRQPCRGFFAARLGVRFLDTAAALEDCEPLALDGLAAHGLRSALLEAALGVHGPERDTRALVLARGVLPLGAAGELLLQREEQVCIEVLARAQAWRGLEPGSHAVELVVDGVLLRGTLERLLGGALRELSVSKQTRGDALLRFWIRHLVACASGAVRADSELCAVDGAYRLRLLAKDTARERLAELVAVYRAGLCEPLPLFPRAAWAFVAAGAGEDGWKEARKVFAPEGDYGFPEADDYCIRRVWPEPELALDQHFAGLASVVFAPLRDALVEAST